MIGKLRGAAPRPADRPQRALPRRFRRPRVLVVGCGDVGQRFARLCAGRARVFGTARRDASADAVRAAGAVPVLADLDAPATLGRLAGLADRVVHLAPPPSEGTGDPRTRRLLAVLRRARRRAPARRAILARGLRAPVRLAYVSTTGVYGDRAGARVDERSVPAPQSARARRRVDAERQVRAAGRRGRIAPAVLRAPGIYAAERLPLERLRRGVPAIAHDEDSWSNHVHADDLARIAWTALLRAPAGRTFNAVDSGQTRMGEWFDLVADACALPRPPRLPRAQVAAHVSPALLSFMRESRRIGNARLLGELRVRLRWPTVRDFLATLPPPAVPAAAGTAAAAAQGATPPPWPDPASSGS